MSQSTQKYCVFTGSPGYNFLVKNMDSDRCSQFGGEMKSTADYEKECNDTFSPLGEVAGYSLYKKGDICWYSTGDHSDSVLGALNAKHAKGGLCAVKGSLSGGYVCL